MLLFFITAVKKISKFTQKMGLYKTIFKKKVIKRITIITQNKQAESIT